MFSTRSSAAKLALVCVLGLVVLKIIVTALTRSISIFAQAMDSFLDVLAVTITFFAIASAAKPADQEHPFGHGKLENVSAAVQAVLLFTAAGIVIYSAISRIVHGDRLRLTGTGIGVMAVSILVSIFLSRHLFRVAKKTESAALEALGHNIAADVFTAAGVLCIMVVISLSHWFVLDAIIALPIAVLIARSGYKVMRDSFRALVDVRLPKAEEKIIIAAIMEHSSRLAGFHEMRTRRAGNQRFIDLHLCCRKPLV